MKYEVKNNYLCISIDKELNTKNLNTLLDKMKLNSKNKNYLLANKYIIRKKEVLHANSILSIGDVIKILIYKENEDNLIPYILDLDIVYEDELFLIVNKPSGLLTHPDTISKKTLANIVKNYYEKNNYDFSVRPIHRLDIDTSGLVIFSKSAVFQPLLDKMLENKEISRHYYALVDGCIEEGKRITIDKPIGKNRHESNQYVIYRNGKDAITNIKSIKYNKLKNITLVECTLDTGRTHQIRVHLQSIEHPVINDKIYFEKSKLTKNMALQAYKIELYHPLKEKNIVIEIPLRDDLVI
jgi:23S rRNA pseudouridine1911/1915/1917 synthase